MKKIDTIVVHHSASKPSTTVEQIRKWHVKGNGWSDIGYHWIITEDGEVHQGRPLPRQGAHCPKVNSHSIGICVTGNFEETKPLPIQLMALAKLIVRMCVEYNIPVANVYPHKEFSATACPGKHMVAYLDQFLTSRS